LNKSKQPLKSFARRLIDSLISLLFGSRAGWLLLKLIRPILAVGLRNTTLTCAGKNDGGGAQVQAIVSVAAFAKFFGARFVHTRLSSIEHCPPGVTMEEFCSRWEKIVSLFGLVRADTAGFVRYNTKQFLIDFLTSRARGKSISLENAHFLTDNHPEVYEQVGLTASARNLNTIQNHKIYAHVRRGDVESTGTTSFRYTSDETLRTYIESVRDQFPSKSKVFIVTENPDAEFIQRFSDCTIVTEKDPVKVILLLANADVLIMGKSAFSYVAALLSKGIVFYETYWQRPLPSWSILLTAPATKDI
jgi:hypothetical protein